MTKARCQSKIPELSLTGYDYLSLVGKLIFLKSENRDQQILGLIPLAEISYIPKNANPKISMINPQSANTAPVHNSVSKLP
jgi:hypothetical protein